MKGNPKVSKQDPGLTTITTTKAGESQQDTQETHQLDLRRRQLERHGAQVIAEPLLLARRRDGHDVLVDAPAQADLAGVDGVFLRQPGEHFVDGAAGCFGHGGLGAVGGEGDVLSQGGKPPLVLAAKSTLYRASSVCEWKVADVRASCGSRSGLRAGGKGGIRSG